MLPKTLFPKPVCDRDLVFKNFRVNDLTLRVNGIKLKATFQPEY